MTHIVGTKSSEPVLRARGLIFTCGPVLIWMGLIFYASSQNTWTVIQGPPTAQALRKSAHIWEYAILAALLGRAMLLTYGSRGKEVTRGLMLRIWRVGVLLCGLYAATDEIHQSFVPKREFHLTDILIDTLSALAALGIIYIAYVERKAYSRRKQEARQAHMSGPPPKSDLLSSQENM